MRIQKQTQTQIRMIIADNKKQKPLCENIVAFKSRHSRVTGLMSLRGGF
jgi:hypothetical protein